MEGEVEQRMQCCSSWSAWWMVNTTGYIVLGCHYEEVHDWVGSPNSDSHTKQHR